MKMVDLIKHPDARNTVKKETTIHRMLSNPNIIQYFGQRSEANMEYIFLEYAVGGELFDRIEPDLGMSIEEARKYFRQLISAVEYMHSRGIAHRDLKPENLLLDANDNLKVSDFGLATVYRLHGKERCLDKRCGTLPYVAPEVLERPYHAEPADIWSCGIILVALLAGELPWDEASKSCEEYNAWCNSTYQSITPWKKLEKSSISIIKKILVPAPSARSTLKDLKRHPWYNIGYKPGDGTDLCDSPISGGIDFSSNNFLDAHAFHKVDHLQVSSMRGQTICYSQPELPPTGITSLTNIKGDERSGLSFSQPVSVEDLLVSSQLQAVGTQASQATNNFQNLVRRMTRFFVSTSFEDTIGIIEECLTENNYHHRVNDYGTITLSTVDKRKMPLIIKMNVIEMDNKTLVDFRLSKGCGIEFKKVFVDIKKLFKHIILSNCNV
ncbi:hypothetical protein TSAR_000341 [Trichomalopsis sarcophagae]|uniref:non-specific serine/threonine protein kinase n=1 Tax=Trichomalopsis sarcophagae TaxID=543379 RepID=A0A232EZK6_9HYME|nr:hypothetical protein TSAR_000341 [Trichomalopsis sarcophagae]